MTTQMLTNCAVTRGTLVHKVLGNRIDLESHGLGRGNGASKQISGALNRYFGYQNDTLTYISHMGKCKLEGPFGGRPV